MYRNNEKVIKKQLMFMPPTMKIRIKTEPTIKEGYVHLSEKNLKK